jgi:hypothetical protein
MRVKTILAIIALALSAAMAVAASAQRYPTGRNANDGGIATEPAGAPQYNSTGQVVPAPGNEVSGNNCAARYRSFDPATRTYLGGDGQRHPCP